MILDLGLVDYEMAYRVQKELVRTRKLGLIDDSVILAEHMPVFTIGRTGRRENLLVGEEVLKKEKIKVLDVDRGGDITFHGPGQLVIYPIIDLRPRGRDLHRYLRDLEEVAIWLLKEYSIFGERLKGKTGVWVDGKKIAFIGIAASDWITYHGLSVNVNADLRFFSMMRPCGLEGVEATSLSAILDKDVMMDWAKERIVYYFDSLFRIRRKRPCNKRCHRISRNESSLTNRIRR